MESRNILIACTGSVATIKIGEIVDQLLNETAFKFEVIKKLKISVLSIFHVKGSLFLSLYTIMVVIPRSK